MAKKGTAPQLGTLIDTLYNAREERLKLQRRVDDMKVAEREVKVVIMERLHTMKLGGSKGAVATASITKEVKPVIEDWKKTWKHIRDNDVPELLHQRVSVEAWRELHEAGKRVPGVGYMEVEDLSLTKATKG